MSAVNRRTFLFGTLGAASVAGRVHAYQEPQKVRLGIIGCAGQGEYNWGNMADEDVRILCDVDLARTANAVKRFPQAEVVQDFRKVLDRKDIDAVVISTPDHWHALMSNWAIEAGKHVYCEKPLSRSVGEARTVAQAAMRKKRITQMGTQIHAGGNYRRVVELVRAGVVGDIKRVDVWCEKQPSPGKKPAPGTEIPSTLDYELWTGPAEMMPYSPQVLPFNWRWWWQYGGGVLADMGCHFMDLPFWALNLRYPKKIGAIGTLFDNADNTVPVEMRVDYVFEGNEDRGEVHLVWWHGTPGPRGEDGNVRNLFGYRNGVLFTGSSGQILADYGRHMLLPEADFKDFKRPDPTIPDSLGHHKEFLEAIRSGKDDPRATTCHFDYSGALTEAVLLGNVSFRLGQEITWDGRRLLRTDGGPGDESILIRPEYRKPWNLRP